ncbi:hypothetical protein HDU96_003486, partial [Phlyctochytrium bullatum]
GIELNGSMAAMNGKLTQLNGRSHHDNMNGIPSPIPSATSTFAPNYAIHPIPYCHVPLWEPALAPNYPVGPSSTAVSWESTIASKNPFDP